jgi:hypothetical protein
LIISNCFSFNSYFWHICTCSRLWWRLVYIYENRNI